MTRLIIDITPTVTTDLKVFPGDTPPSREVLLDMQRGDHITLSTLRTTVHLGAHVDAPSHYGVDERTIEQMPLELFIGHCQVIDTTASAGRLVSADDLMQDVQSDRVLLRTGTYPDPDTWTASFAGLEPSLVDHLASNNVRLVGVDTPSVDPSTVKVLDAHHRFLAHDIAILEGIVLDGVEAGFYELIATPLKLAGFDGSPVRAVLRTLE